MSLAVGDLICQNAQCIRVRSLCRLPERKNSKFTKNYKLIDVRHFLRVSEVIV